MTQEVINKVNPVEARRACRNRFTVAYFLPKANTHTATITRAPAMSAQPGMMKDIASANVVGGFIVEMSRAVRERLYAGDVEDGFAEHGHLGVGRPFSQSVERSDSSRVEQPEHAEEGETAYQGEQPSGKGGNIVGECRQSANEGKEAAKQRSDGQETDFRQRCADWETEMVRAVKQRVAQSAPCGKSENRCNPRCQALELKIEAHRD